MTPWVFRLLTANIAVFVATSTLPGLAGLLAFIPAIFHLRPWTPLTYMFVHAGFWHIGLNMLILFFFGPRLEQRLGAKRFLTLYFLSGLGGALFFVLFDRGSAVVGASGAVYGVVAGFAYFWPRENIYIWGILPIQARWLAGLVIVGSVYAGLNTQSMTAHFAHVGGLLLAFGYLWWLRWRQNRKRDRWREEVLHGSVKEARKKRRTELQRWKAIRLDALHELNRQEVRGLLEKVEAKGLESLTRDERTFLDRMADSAPPA